MLGVLVGYAIAGGFRRVRPQYMPTIADPTPPTSAEVTAASRIEEMFGARDSQGRLIPGGDFK